MISLMDFMWLARVARRRANKVVPVEEELTVTPTKYDALAELSWNHVWHLRECMICLSDFEEDDDVVQLPCKHVFHVECAGAWLRRNKGCPAKCVAKPITLATTSPTALGRADVERPLLADQFDVDRPVAV